MQGVLPSSYMQDTGRVSKVTTDRLELSMDHKTLPFYETLLNMWIITGRRVSPCSCIECLMPILTVQTSPSTF